MKTYVESNFLVESLNSSCDSDSFDKKSQNPQICYNIKSDNGCLVQGNGIKEAILPISQASEICSRVLDSDESKIIKKIWKYSYYSTANSRFEYMLVAYFSDHKIYYSNIFAANTHWNVLASSITFNEEPIAVTFQQAGKDVIAFCSPSDSLLVWNCDSTPVIVSTAPKVKSICFHDEKLFVIDSDKDYVIRYSTDKLIDWTSSNGDSYSLNDYKVKLKKLVSFKDSLYVFWDFGIAKVSLQTNGDYKMSNIYTSGTKLYENSVIIAKNYIYFMSEDGLYSFSGSAFEKLNLNISNFLSYKQDNCQVCLFDNNLYIACKLNFCDLLSIGQESENNFVNNALIEYNLSTNSYNITRGIDVTSMVQVKDLFLNKLLITVNGGNYGYKLFELTPNGKLDSNVLNRYFMRKNFDFKTFNKTKILKEIGIFSNYDFQIEVKTEKISKVFNVIGKNIYQRIKINLPSNNFEIAFKSSNENFSVSDVQYCFKEEK